MKKPPKPDRERIVKTTLASQGNDAMIANATPGERMGMVWQLTLDAWAFTDPDSAKREFQRHIVHVQRGRNAEK